MLHEAKVLVCEQAQVGPQAEGRTRACFVRN